MLMPGRYLTDTASRCALITQTVMMHKWTTVPININQTNLLPLAGGALTFSTAKVTLSASAPGSGFYQIHTVQPGLQQSLAIKTGYVTGAQMVALVTEVVGADTVLLASGGIERDGLLNLAFTPSQSSVLLKVVHNGGFGMAGTMEVTLISKDELSWEPKNTLLSVCNSELDRYRFGFNGHQKDNEIAGIGNHLSFGDFGFSTRLARRWTMDPKWYELNNLSPYSVYFNNPVIYNDPDGKVPLLTIVGGALGGAVIEFGSQVISSMARGESFTSAIEKVDWFDVVVATAEGAILGSGGGLAGELILIPLTTVTKSGIDYKEGKLSYVGGKDDYEKTSKDFGVDLASGALGSSWGRALGLFVKSKVAEGLIKTTVNSGVDATLKSIVGENQSQSNSEKPENVNSGYGYVYANELNEDGTRKEGVGVRANEPLDEVVITADRK